MQRVVKQIHGNYYDKYNSGNPISRFLANGFIRDLNRAVSLTGSPHTVLEIGCGDGTLAHRTRTTMDPLPAFTAFDPGFEEVKQGHISYPDIHFFCGSIYDLPFGPNQFDLVIIPEVLEHLEDPGYGLEKAAQIGREYFILSVPSEPVWRIGNMLSGRYLRSLGNTPGHIQHWSRNAFLRFIEPVMEPIHVFSPLPWTLVLARKRNAFDSC